MEKPIEKLPLPEVRIKISLWNLLLSLFICPHRILPFLLLEGKVLKPWLIFTACFSLISLVLITSLSPKLYQSLTKECEQLTTFVGTVQVMPKDKDAQFLTFPEIKSFPQKFSFATFPIDIVIAEPQSELTLHPQNQNDRWTLWTNGKKFCLYSQGEIQKVDVSFLEKKQSDEIQSFSPEEHLAFLKPNLQVMVPFFLAIIQAINYFFIMLMGLFFMFITNLFWQRGIINLQLYFYAGITALLSSMVYSLIPEFGLGQFLRIFSWSLAIYLGVVIIILRMQVMNQKG